MLGKNGECFNDYVIWLEDILFKFLLNDYNGGDLIESMKRQIDILGPNLCNDDFVEYLSEKDERDRYDKQGFLFDVKYIDDCNMNQFYLSLLKEEKIIIDEEEKIKKLKLLLCEFLSQCGYGVSKFRKNILENKVSGIKKNEIDDRKKFDKVEASNKNGEKRIITVFYGTLRGLTTWYAKRDKVSSKIVKDKNGDYIYNEKDKKVTILDKDVIDYISKDYG